MLGLLQALSDHAAEIGIALLILCLLLIAAAILIH